MATISGASLGAGGKIVKRRRNGARTTPYDRPTPPPHPPPESSNWLTGLIGPASRMIANGAGKLQSWIYDSTSSSSSSSSSSDVDSSSEHCVDDDFDGTSLDMADGSRKKKGTSSEIIRCFGRESHLNTGKCEIKRVIEQLIIQETFSREERDRLLKIINSRVVDCSTLKEGQDAGQVEIPSQRVGDDTPDLCSKAIMEAKQWLEEKKVGNSDRDAGHQTFAYNSVMLKNVSEGEAGSPLDMAKSYMRTRPPWASPSFRRGGSGKQSPKVVELFMEGTPSLVGSHSLSSEQKRGSLSAGTWNIQEEIRRVRSKATEDMLRTPPSIKLDLSSFAQETNASQKSSMADTVRGNGDIQEFNFLAATEPDDASENLAAGVSTSHALPGPSGYDMAYNGSRDEPSSLLPALFVSDPNQDSKLGQIVKAEGGASESHNSTMQELSSMQHLDTNPRSSDGNLSTEKDLTDCRTAPNANSLPSSEFSLSAGIMIESHRRSGEDVSNAASSDHDILKSNVPVQETCALLSEASIEVPVVYETNSKFSGSQTSSSMHGEELSQDTSQVDTKRSSLVGNNAGSIIEKQPQKKPSGYHRKGRGRGR